MQFNPISSGATDGQARHAATLAVAALSPKAMPVLPATPRAALGGMAACLAGDAATAGRISIVSAPLPQQPGGDAWRLDGRAGSSAWACRYRAAGTGERPLLYLMRARSVEALRALLAEASQRGILCNDALPDTGRGQGMQAGLPAWLAAHAHCLPYDPASAEEARAIVRAALQSLYIKGQGGFVYLAAHDQAAAPQQALPPRAAAAAVRGMLRVRAVSAAGGRASVRLCGAGRALAPVLAAANLLQQDWGVQAEVWSCPSYTRLAREAAAAERWSLLHPQSAPRRAHLHRCLDGSDAPVLAVTAYGQHIAGQIGGHVRARFVAIGAGMPGMMGIAGIAGSECGDDAQWLAVAALKALADDGRLARACLQLAVQRYGLAG